MEVELQFLFVSVSGVTGWELGMQGKMLNEKTETTLSVKFGRNFSQSSWGFLSVFHVECKNSVACYVLFEANDSVSYNLCCASVNRGSGALGSSPKKSGADQHQQW